MFQTIKGKNILLDKSYQIAVWHPTKTGGCLFTKDPMSERKPVSLVLKGTGGVEMGILDRDPESFRDTSLVSSTSICGYQFLNDVKIHKRTCNMKFSINNKTKEVTSSYGSGHYSQQIQPDKPYWLAIDVKYGEVELQLQNDEHNNCPQQFSRVHGNNIQLLNDPTVARSCQKSPASLSFYRQPVHKGLQLTLHCTPRAHQGMVPGRYYVLLSYTTKTPEQLQQQHPDLFDLSFKKDRDPGMTQIEKFEKEDCTGGPITLVFQESDLVYTAASGKVNRQTGILNSNRDVWLAIEVYGVEVRLTEQCAPSAGGSTEVDSVAPSGLSRHHQDSAAPSGLSRHHQDSAAPSGLSRQHPSLSYFEVSSEPLDITPAEEGIPMQVDSVFLPHENQPTAGEPSVLNVSDVTNTVSMNNLDTEDSYDLSEPIRRKWTKLLDTFEAKQFAGHMYEEGLINLRQFQELPDICTKEVLIILSKRRVRKKFMLHALESTSQSHLEKTFFPDVEKE